MIDICLADGEIKEDEITMISTTYAEIMGQPTSRRELEHWIDCRRGKNEGRQSSNEPPEKVPFRNCWRFWPGSAPAWMTMAVK
jgi:hypothetical protein